MRLARYYRGLGSNDDVRRVIGKYIHAFQEAAQNAEPLQASAWLQNVHRVCVEYGLTDSAEEVAKQVRALGPKVIDNMETVSSSFQISKEDMSKYVAGMTEGSLDTVLMRIVQHYMPNKATTLRQLQDLQKEAPISFLVDTRIHDHRGRPVARVGPLDTDEAGHLVMQVAQNLSLSSLFLREVLATVETKFSLTADILTQAVYCSPLFDPEKRDIIGRGIAAYLARDHLTAVHMLIPQIEDAIRAALEVSGGSVLKASRSGGFTLKTLDELLRDPSLEGVFGGDATLYFRVVLTDQRGWNLRNNVCHGLVRAKDIGSGQADRVMHILLCLSLVREDIESAESTN